MNDREKLSEPPCGEKIPLSMPIIDEDMVKSAIDALLNDKLVNGEYVKKFEEAFAKFIGTDYALATNSGTSALILAYKSININKNNFIVPDATFIATAAAGVIAGGEPVLADIELSSYNIDFNHLIKLLNTFNIKVVVPVHLYGYPVDMDKLIELKSRYNFMIIEDAAQAHGAVYKGRKVGSIGDVGIFSFYPIKNMTVGGDGGMLVTNDEKIYKIAYSLRDNGRVSKYKHDKIGYVFRLNSVNAAIGLIQLKKLNDWNEKRREIAREYDSKLSASDEIIIPPGPNEDKVPVYHIYAIRLKNYSIRNSLGAWLESHGVQALVHYPLPLHKQPALSKLIVNVRDSFESSEQWASSILSLPMYPLLDSKKINCIADLILEFLENRLYNDNMWRKRGQEWLRKFV